MCTLKKMHAGKTAHIVIHFLYAMIWSIDRTLQNILFTVRIKLLKMKTAKKILLTWRAQILISHLLAFTAYNIHIIGTS